MIIVPFVVGCNITFMVLKGFTFLLPKTLATSAFNLCFVVRSIFGFKTLFNKLQTLLKNPIFKGHNWHSPTMGSFVYTAHLLLFFVLSSFAFLTVSFAITLVLILHYCTLNRWTRVWKWTIWSSCKTLWPQNFVPLCKSRTSKSYVISLDSRLCTHEH